MRWRLPCLSPRDANLDGTGNIITANELNFLEGADVGAAPLGPNLPNPPLFADGEGCAQEGQLDTGGGDAPGAVWDLCPTIPDHGSHRDGCLLGYGAISERTAA